MFRASWVNAGYSQEPSYIILDINTGLPVARDVIADRTRSAGAIQQNEKPRDAATEELPGQTEKADAVPHGQEPRTPFGDQARDPLRRVEHSVLPRIRGVRWLDGRASMLSSHLWLAVRPFGNVGGDPFQKKFADQIRHSIRTKARQTIDND
jgi:hypothetical protein